MDQMEEGPLQMISLEINKWVITCGNYKGIYIYMREVAVNIDNSDSTMGVR